jgi:signal transduction histidine kinase
MVDRRTSTQPPPSGIERRSSDSEASAPLNPKTAPLWPFRVAALGGALLRIAAQERWSHETVLLALGGIVLYTIIVSVRPIQYIDDPRTRMRVALELGLITILVMLSGSWTSPFTLCLIPSVMLAGFCAGGWFSAQLAAFSVVVISAQHIPTFGARLGFQDAALWGSLLLLISFTSGLAHRAALDAARQQRISRDRMSRLTEANTLLFALQRVAQSLPASLDMDDVLDSTMGRVRTMIEPDVVVVYTIDLENRVAEPLRSYGIHRPPTFSLDRLPAGLNAALESSKTVRFDAVEAASGVTPSAGSGLYTALRARGAIVGLIAAESVDTHQFGPQQAEIMHGLAEPFGVAIDNARMFRQIRTLAADEERTRIARDLHDHIGSSLALIGFEVDHAASLAKDGGLVGPALIELRKQIKAVVAEVRETLFDLRTEITEEKDILSTLSEYLQRVGQRSNLVVQQEVRVEGRMPLLHERELWQIIREAITNVERHAKASTLTITGDETPVRTWFIIADDGVGIGAPTDHRPGYGMLGMRERAQRIGAEITVHTPPEGGTEVRVLVTPPEGRSSWETR